MQSVIRHKLKTEGDTRSGFKTEIREGEAPAEPAFVASSTRQVSRLPSFETASNGTREFH